MIEYVLPFLSIPKACISKYLNECGTLNVSNFVEIFINIDDDYIINSILYLYNI